MSKKKNFIVISAGRSDYYRYFPIINEMQKKRKANIYIYITQFYNNKTFGSLKRQIKKNFKYLPNYGSGGCYGDSAENMVKNLNLDIRILSKHVSKLKPDFILLMGDRYEMMLGPIVSIPHNIPVIHLFGGAVTEGAIDELFRHALTKMSHFHLVLLDRYKKRLHQLGEEKWRVKKIGMPSLWNISKIKKNNLSVLGKNFNFDFSKPFMLATFHPVTLEIKELKNQINSLIKAIKLSKINAVVTYPNSDPKFNIIIKMYKREFKDKKKYLLVKNLGEENYFSLMCHAKLMLGNSSSGIVESPTFKIPAINVGTRQDGKYKASNVINTNYDHLNILKAIKKSMQKKFVKKLKKIKNPYKSTISPKKIARIILNLKVNDKLLRKKFLDLK